MRLLTALDANRVRVVPGDLVRGAYGFGNEERVCRVLSVNGVMLSLLVVRQKEDPLPTAAQTCMTGEAKEWVILR